MPPANKKTDNDPEGQIQAMMNQQHQMITELKDEIE